MCCQSKKKVVTQEANPQKNVAVAPVYVAPTTTSKVNGYNVVSPYGSTYTTNNYTNNSAVPKSTISFSAHDYDSSPLTNQSAFVSTRKVTHLVQDRGDRLEDYAYEINQAKDSKLLMPNSILNYDLDIEDGVSKTPVINTFHYESVLNHCFLRNYPNQNGQLHVNNSVVRQSPYQSHLNNSGVDLRKSLNNSSYNDSRLA